MIQKRLLVFCTLLLMLACASGARAQYGASRGYQRPKKDEEQRKEYFGSINVFPVAAFDIGGTFASGSGTQSLIGVLTDVEFGTVDRGRDKQNYTEYSIGGWYWGRAGNDLYEVHVRALTKRGLGLQIGYLNTTQGFVARAGVGTNGLKTDAEAYDIFLIYNLSSTSVDHSTPTEKEAASRHAWNIEFGLGAYIDESQHYFPNTGVISRNATANYTFYVSAAYQISGNLYINASNWTLRNRFQDLNRLSVGVGLHF